LLFTLLFSCGLHLSQYEKEFHDLQSPFSDLAVHVPPFRQKLDRPVIPGFSLVLTDLFGTCMFGNFCLGQAMANYWYSGHEHVIEAILFSLENKCILPSSAALAVDIGANLGFFTVLIASLVAEL